MITNKKLLSMFLACSCLFIKSVAAQSASDAYQTKLSDNETGVYEDGNWVFFVVKQQCLTNKKFAGTAESKAAEKTFYTMLAKEVVVRSVSFSSEIKGIMQPLRSDIKQDVSMRLNARTALTHKLLFDRNSQTDSCTQEYVVVLDREQFKSNGVIIPRNQVESSAVSLILMALERKDFVLTQQYLHSLGQRKLADIYQLINGNQVLSVNLNTNDLVELCNASFCSLSAKPFSAHDINKVIATAILNNGLVKFENINPSVQLADLLYRKAQANFSAGTNANEIIQDLTLAINLAPQQARNWKMLADIARALGKEDLFKAATAQSILLEPESAESWVYLYLSIKDAEPVIANNLIRWLKLIDQQKSFSSWAKKQINGE
ncbi:hypothetical protein ITG10_00285 [Vibrio sp. ED004]|uniref:hypothetical protein n=2 Tax=unclassified Vibrio TaxID=2614977 RepID=UPI002054A838|nr:hypothetical protein [Vibrio sp. ED004]UPR56852.1 hypothetical protein ITG10_00285 [Vibrio sp. ED004]